MLLLKQCVDVGPEEWRPVAGFDDLYLVSSMGRIQSLRKQRLLAPYISGSGYPSIHLFRNKQRTVCSLHRLVAAAFLGPPDDPALEVNHIDGNKLNNAVSNLEWATRQENVSHASKNGLLRGPKLFGEKNASAKLTLPEVEYILKSRGKVRQVDLADRFGVSQQTVSAIQTGVAWSEALPCSC